MSLLLLSRLSRFCHRKPASIRSSLILLSNGFSSSKLLQTPPCKIILVSPCGEDMAELLFDYGFAICDTNVVKKEKKVPLGLTKEMGTIGASHGWVAAVKPDGTVSLQDDLIPVASETHPKRISLPPFETLPGCQTQIVTSMAMSSSSPEEDEDCIVAFKFMGPQLSFCKPAQTNPEWINIEIQNPCFFSSPLMFSKKEDMFRIPGSGGHIIGSWDLHNHNHNPKIQMVQFEDYPELEQSEIELLDTCYRSEHLVESTSTGETFLVKLYKKAYELDDETIKMMPTQKKKETIKMITVGALTFKVNEEGIAVFTLSTADINIYLSKAEPFTVRASSFPGLFESRILVSDADECKYVGTVFISDREEQEWFLPDEFPYLIPPQNIV